MKQVLIIGDSPIVECIVSQYVQQDFNVTRSETLSSESLEKFDLSVFDELVISPTSEMDYDSLAIEALSEIASKINTLEKGQARKRTHLILTNSNIFHLLQTTGLSAEINDKLEVYPSTMADNWAKNVLIRLPSPQIRTRDYPPLDRESITHNSEKFVHLVISGFDEYAQALAINAALIAHFPNYKPSDEHPLRTRITIVSEGISSEKDSFIAKYKHLFDNSFYRLVLPSQAKSSVHVPKYYGERMDFVDVEWEFVDSTLSHPIVMRQIQNWASSNKHLLTLALCSEQTTNIQQAESLASMLQGTGVPILIRLDKDIYSKLQSCAKNKDIYPFGMTDQGYDISLPLFQLAKLLNYFYVCSYSDKGSPTYLPAEEVEEHWNQEKSIKMRMSNVFNVMTLQSKMRSVGHDQEDFDSFYALNQNEIELLSETEHNRWSVERLIMGCRPCNDEERKMISKNISDILNTDPADSTQAKPVDLKKKYKRELYVHYDLCAYDELDVDPTGKNAKVYDYALTECIPLLVSTFYNNSKVEQNG